MDFGNLPGTVPIADDLAQRALWKPVADTPSLWNLPAAENEFGKIPLGDVPNDIAGVEAEPKKMGFDTRFGSRRWMHNLLPCATT